MLAFDDHPVPHVIYDLSLPLPERIERAMWFRSAHQAANWLGVPPKQLYSLRVPGKRIKKGDKEYAIRIAKQWK
jgi:hypothetical protein